MDKVLKNKKITDFNFVRTIEKTSLGDVKICIVKHDKKDYYFIAKVMKKSLVLKSRQQEHAKNEIIISKSLRFNFLSEVVGMYQDQIFYIIFTNYANGGTINDRLAQQTVIKSEHAKFYAAQIVQAIKNLTNMKGCIVHRDIKCENIFIYNDGYIALGNFSLAKILDKTKNNRTYTFCGTPEYIAPEIIENKGYGQSVDFWSLGITIYEMNCGHSPFMSHDPMDIYQQILKCKIKFPKKIKSDCKELLQGLIVKDLTQRLGNLKNGISDIINHYYFSRINWDKLNNHKLDVPWKPTQQGEKSIQIYPQFGSDKKYSTPLDQKDDPFQQW